MFQFTKQQLAYLIEGCDLAIASARRGQNSGKNPKFVELYKQSESDYSALKVQLDKMLKEYSDETTPGQKGKQ